MRRKRTGQAVLGTLATWLAPTSGLLGPGAEQASTAAAASPDFDLRDLIDGAALLASTANAVMQLALPAVGYGVLESKVESGQVMPRPFGTALGPVNRFLTTGFLPPPFREQMQLPWTEGDQRQFDVLIQMVASVYRLLPAPVARFPFNASLQELRLRTWLTESK